MVDERKWPLAGYAPGGYTCHCVKCGGEFTGDKRAYNCLPCAKMITSYQAHVASVNRATDAEIDAAVSTTRATTPTACELVEALRDFAKAMEPVVYEVGELSEFISDDCVYKIERHPILGLSDFDVGDLRRIVIAFRALYQAALSNIGEE